MEFQLDEVLSNPWASLQWLLPLAFIGSALSYVAYQRFIHPLASIPGPFWASLTRLWMTKHSWDGDMNVTMISLHENYGTLVRTGPNEVSVSDLAAIKSIYGAGTKFRKSDWYSVWQGHRKFDLFAERDERIHGEQRRLVSRAYSMDALKDLEPYVDNAVDVFLDNMSQKQDQVIDLGNWVQLFAFGTFGRASIWCRSCADRRRRDRRGVVQQTLRLHGCI